MKRFSILGWAVVVILMVVGEARAQLWVTPGPESGPPVLCTTCPRTWANLPTWRYSPPIKDFVGRFVDSSNTRDYQHGYGYRTMRAEMARVVPERNRVYMVLGETFAAYDLSNFFTQQLGSPLTRVSAYADPGADREIYLPFKASVYAELDPSYVANVAEGQERLYSFDWDDRGYVYLAYGIFGMGIHQDTGGGTLPLIKQVGRGTSDPRGMAVVWTGNKYYAYAKDDAKINVYDVTNPAAPTIAGTMSGSFRDIVAVRDGSQHTVAVINGGAIELYRPSGSLTTPFAEIRGSKTFQWLATDGTNLYALSVASSSSAARLSVIRPQGSTFVSTEYPVRGDMAITLGVGAGAGHVAVWGFVSAGGVATTIYELQNGVPNEINTGDFFHKHYSTSPPAGYASPTAFGPYGTNVNEIRFERWGSSVYMFYSGHGLGDVYELQAGDAIDISLGSSGVRTPNPNSAGNAQDLYPGDPIQFVSSSSGSPLSINWDFGNPESPNNTNNQVTGTPVVHQYANLTTSAAVTARKSVTARAVSDTSNSDTVFVDLKVPTARIRLEANKSEPLEATAALLVGDNFVDASDGSVQSHYATWTIGGTATHGAPNSSISVGPCTAGENVTLQAQYGPYTTPGTALAGTSPYTASATLSYSVRPFVAQVEFVPSASTGSSLVFRNATRRAAATHFSGTSAPMQLQWDLLDANGNPVAGQSLTA
ncbi:MAG: hypothetical protein ACRD2J_17915, partial [Thermoanaerobaculia bacterium]